MDKTRKIIVSLVSCPSYDLELLRVGLVKLLEPFGGIRALVSPGQKVLLKPNMLAAAAPGEAVTTHPVLLRAVAEAVVEAGGEVFIGDSPGSDEQEKAHLLAGYSKVMELTGAKMLLFDRIKPVRSALNPERLLPIAAAIEKVDLVFNLAKLKTHSLTGLTGAVKNLYGCIPGGDKKRYHFLHPLPLDFSRVLIDVCLTVKPVFSIMDAIVAMEGIGPRRGRPRKLGLLLGSDNPFSLDRAAAELLGFLPGEVTTILAARDLKIPGSHLKELDLVGAPIGDLKPEHFDRGPAASGKISRLLANFPVAWLKNFLYARRPYPVVDSEKCCGCEECIENCPLKIIELRNGVAYIDHYDCIRCYCCQEHCACGAIELL